MAGEWTRLRLGDVCTKIGSGATPRGGSSVYLEQGDVALIRSQNIYNDGFHHDGIVYLSKKHADELANVEVVEQDVLLNITGDSVARACQVDPNVLPARVNQHVAIIRPDPKQLSPLYLRYFLVSAVMQAKMLSMAGAGATRNALTKGMIEEFTVFAPPDVREQQAIACVLGALDDKIELNRRMHETLEAMARAIFKSWFVDFDPVRAKAAGQEPVGLAPEIADLFPDAFEDSELGAIPKGWRVCTIGELATVVGGSTPSTKEPRYWDDGTHCWATPRDLSALATPVLLDTERRITDAGLEQISSGLLPAGTVLLSSRAPIGYLAIAQVPVAINQGFIAMKPQPGMSAHFLLRWAEASQADILSRANGSTFLEISKTSFRTIGLVVPADSVQSAFHGLLEPIFTRVVSSEMESRTLSALRDALLPKLVSGELRIKDAEKIVERCV